MWRTKVIQIYKKTGTQRPVQLLLGQTKMDCTLRALAGKLEGALATSEAIEIQCHGLFCGRAIAAVARFGKRCAAA